MYVSKTYETEKNNCCIDVVVLSYQEHTKNLIMFHFSNKFNIGH